VPADIFVVANVTDAWIAESGDDAGRRIGGAVIGDDQLEIRDRLRKHGRDGLLQVGGPVVRRQAH
jgi:hypothetical protein